MYASDSENRIPRLRGSRPQESRSLPAWSIRLLGLEVIQVAEIRQQGLQVNRRKMTLVNRERLVPPNVCT